MGLDQTDDVLVGDCALCGSTGQFCFSVKSEILNEMRGLCGFCGQMFLYALHCHENHPGETCEGDPTLNLLSREDATDTADAIMNMFRDMHKN